MQNKRTAVSYESVIKALKCFAIDKDFDENQCIGCAFENETLCCENASEGIAKKSLNLFYCMQAENKNLKIQLHNSKLHEKEAVEALKNERRYKSHDTKMINSEALNKFAEQVKMAFYYEFDELIPSIMADKIDNISEEILKTITKESYKPIPHSLGQYGSGTEVLYRCAKCGADFRILGKHETFCHGCGVKQDWENSPIYCSEQFKEMYNELVYKKHAYIQGNRDVDKELKQLLFRFYKGELR